MGHPLVFNHTPFHFEPLPLTDDLGRPVLVGLVKASFRLPDGGGGAPVPLAEQIAFDPAGEALELDGELCHRYEPEGVLPKPGTDVVLIATARAPRAGLTSFDVGFRVGDAARRARVFGRRVWRASGAGLAISEPEVVERVPLDYAHAFGGRDESATVGGLAPVERRNPVGVGYHHRRGTPHAGAPLPSVERPEALIRGYHDAPEPAGFGFVGPHWEPRVRYAGTYDAVWERERRPWLPLDFDARHHNSAAAGLTLAHRPAGGERVSVINASPLERLEFALPRLAPPRLHAERRGGRRAQAETALDTLVVDTDRMLLLLYFRAAMPLPGGMHSLAKVAVTMERAPRVGPRPVAPRREAVPA